MLVRRLGLVWSALARRLGLFAIVALTAAAAGLGWSMHAYAPYEACAIVLSGAPVAPGALSERVSRQLHLSADPEFAAGGDGSLHSVAAQVSRQVRAKRRGATYLAEVCFVSRDRVKAAMIANAFTDMLLADVLEDNMQASARANAWLAARLAELRVNRIATEGAVEELRAEIVAEGTSAERATLLAQAERRAEAGRTVYEAMAARTNECCEPGAERMRLVSAATPPQAMNNPARIAALWLTFWAALLAGFAAAGAAAWLDARATPRPPAHWPAAR